MLTVVYGYDRSCVGIIAAFSLSGRRVVREFDRMIAERVTRKSYRTRDETRADAFDCIERFYNPRHEHSTRDYECLVGLEAKIEVA